MNMRTFIRSIPNVPWFLSCYARFRKENASSDFPIGRLRPYLTERFEQEGTAGGHYFHQDLLVARRIFMNAPQTHYDVGSRVDGFVAHVALP